MKNTEEVTEEMSRLVIFLCDKYRMIQMEELKAKAELHDYAKSSAEAVITYGETKVNEGGEEKCTRNSPPMHRHGA